MDKNIYTKEIPMRFEEEVVFSLQTNSIGECGPMPNDTELDFESSQTKEQRDTYVKNKMDFIKERGFDAHFGTFQKITKVYFPEDIRNRKILNESTCNLVTYIFDSLEKKEKRITLKTCKFEELNSLISKKWHEDLCKQYKDKHINNYCLLFEDKGDKWIIFTKEIIFTSSLV